MLELSSAFCCSSYDSIDNTGGYNAWQRHGALGFVKLEGGVKATNQAMLDLWDSYVSKDFNDITPTLLTVHAGDVVHCRDQAIRSVADFEGQTQRQVAEALGLTLPGAKSRVQRARRMLAVR